MKRRSRGRVPRTPEEDRLARLLAETFRGGRPALIERLADDLRRRGAEPLSRAPEAGLFGLALYREQAAALVDSLLGDLLVEVEID